MENDVRICPKCGSEKSRVDDVRVLKTSDILMRSRICEKCGESWRSYEVHRDFLRKLIGFYNTSTRLMQKYNDNFESIEWK